LASTYEIKIVSDSRDADQKIAALEKRLNKLTEKKAISFQFPSMSDINNGFKNLQKEVSATIEFAKQLYNVLKQVPGLAGPIGMLEQKIKAVTLALISLPQQIAQGFGNAASAILGATNLTRVFTGSLQTAGAAVNALVINIAKIGFAFFGIQQAIGMLRAAYLGFFNETIGREIKLRETLLRTQTTLASTSRVFAGGKEVTDPYQKIVTLTGAISKNIDSIRLRSLELAGVTSDEVIQVFSIVSSQIGNIGGSLKDAEDLAIKFSAALGTFGIPLYQAQQEIGSIFRGDITADSYLARSLGITNADITRAKSQAGGVVKFLNDKLAASQAGQKIAADGFSGITSNIREFFEISSQAFGKGLLDPLLQGLRAVFEGLQSIKDEVATIASQAGNAIGRVGLLGASTFSRATGLGNVNGQEVAQRSAELLQKAFVALEAVARRTFNAIAAMAIKLAPSFQMLGEAALVFSKAVIQLNVAKFEAMISTVTLLVQTFGSLLEPVASLVRLYAALAATPVVRFFAEVSTTLTILKRAGLDAIMTVITLGTLIFTTLGPVTSAVVTAGGAILGTIAGVILAIGKLTLALATVAAAFAGPLTAIPAAKAALTALSVSLETTGNQALVTGTKVGVLNRAFQGVGAAAKGAALGFIAASAKMAAIQIGIALLVKAWGDFQRRADDQKATINATKALALLETELRNVGDQSSAAQRAQKAFQEGLVSTRYSEAQVQVAKLKEELGELIKLRDRTAGVNLFNIKTGQITDVVTQLFKGGRLAEVQKEIKTLEDFMKRRDAIEDEKNRAQDVTTAANAIQQDTKRLLEARKQLEREVIDFRRSQESTLFTKRQEVARKEIDIVQAAGELRIQGIARANRQLREGVEGSARVALERLDAYIENKERGELELQVQERNFQLDMAELDRSVADFRIETEQRIVDMREKIAKYEMEVSKWRIEAAKAEGAARASGEAGGSAGGSGDAKAQATDLLKRKEGFRGQAYWDVNHWRVGYGSDTMTTPSGGVQKTQQSSTVTQADAERDLSRRVDDILRALEVAFGESFKKLPEAAKAALVSLQYNYGRVPQGVAVGIKGGDLGKIAQAIENLKDQDGGVNRNRRIEEANMIRSARSYGAGGGLGNVLPDLKTPPNWNDGLGAPRSHGPHQGQDLGTEPLAAVAALENGVVTAISKGFGKVGQGIFIKYGDGKTGVYGHVDPSVKVGQKITAGQQIGKVSNDGTNSHLHYEYWDKAGNLLDPTARLRASIKAPPGMKAGSSGAAPVNLPPPPAAPTLDSSILQSAKNFENIVSRLKARSRELLDLQQKIKAAALADEFTQIGKDLFPNQAEGIRQTKMGLEDVEAKLRAIGESGKEAFDADAFGLTREITNFNAEAERTFKLFVDGVKARKLSEEESSKLIKQATADYERSKKEMKEIVDLKRQQLDLERQSAILGGLKDQVRGFERDTQKRRIDTLTGMATSLIPQGPGSILKTREMEAEADIRKRRIDAEAEKKGPLTGLALEEFNKLAEAIRASAKEFGALEEAMAAYAEKVAEAREITQTVIGGAKGLVSSLIKGGDLKGELSRYFANIGGTFTDKALNQAFKPLEQAFQKQMENLLGAKLEQDPKMLLQQENNSKLEQNTVALQNLAQSLNSGSFFGGEGEGIDWSAGLGTEFDQLGASLDTTFTSFASSLTTGLGSLFSGGSFNFGSFLPLLGNLFGGFFAEGGDPPIGKVSVVGENGPELIVPKSATTVIPNRSLNLKGGGMNINPVSASFRNLERSVPDMASTKPLQVEYKSQVINDVRYVTDDEFRKGMSQAAARGQAMAYSGMRNNAGIRRQLGL
jgi:murein DD-endopeptidase MepM/ murein hydrolase activator NlpD